MKWTLSRKNNTFDLVELLKGRKILKNNWVIKLKQDNYKLVKHKAHSNLKGFGQNENFSLVIKSSSIWVVLDLATSLNLAWRSKDDIYMEEPYDFEEKGNNHLLCKLKNTLFEPSTKAMYTKFDSFIVSQNYIMTIGYHCQYVKYFSKGNFILFLLYVDDMLIVGHDWQVKGEHIKIFWHERFRAC